MEDIKISIIMPVYGVEEFVEINKKTANRAAALPGTDGANGMRAVMPSIFLLPYWMGRYHGLLGD